MGNHKIASLSWIFRGSKITWDYLLLTGVKLVLERHGMTEGVLISHKSEWGVQMGA